MQHIHLLITSNLFTEQKLLVAHEEQNIDAYTDAVSNLQVLRIM